MAIAVDIFHLFYFLLSDHFHFPPFRNALLITEIGSDRYEDGQISACSSAFFLIKCAKNEHWKIWCITITKELCWQLLEFLLIFHVLPLLWYLSKKQTNDKTKTTIQKHAKKRTKHTTHKNKCGIKQRTHKLLMMFFI